MSKKKIDFFNNNQIKNTKKDKNNKTIKRRGRRPKKILNDVDINNPEENAEAQQNNTAVILRLNIDPNKLKNIKQTKPTSQKRKSKKIIVEDPSEDSSSEGMFKNDIPEDNLCQKCIKNEKTIMLLKSKLEKYEKKEKIDRSNKLYYNKLDCISHTTGKKIVIKKTNIRCWWDTKSFTNLPFYLPELYHNGTYHVLGCFCSINCALAYNRYYLRDSKIGQRKSLAYKFYREIYGLSFDEILDVKEAPPREMLEDFGGQISLDVFRRRCVMLNKEYTVYIPPIKPITISIEERNIETSENDQDKKYILKRSKPLSKKRSVISSMMKTSSKEKDE